MLISLKDEGTWRTLTALRESVRFYKSNNLGGKYDRVIGKEEAHIKRFMGEIEYELADKIAA